MKRNGQNIEYQVTLNIPHLREKIKKTCANRPVSCVNGEVRTDLGSLKEPAYRCVAALGRRACPLRHRLRSPRPGCGSQRLLRCRSHPAGRCPNSSSLFPPLALGLRLLLFLQPLGGALKKQNAALASPPFICRWQRSAPLQSSPLPPKGEPLAKPFTLRGLPKPPLGRGGGIAKQ